jgi:hypothetical protein
MQIDPAAEKILQEKEDAVVSRNGGKN